MDKQSVGQSIHIFLYKFFDWLIFVFSLIPIYLLIYKFLLFVFAGYSVVDNCS